MGEHGGERIHVRVHVESIVGARRCLALVARVGIIAGARRCLALVAHGVRACAHAAAFLFLLGIVSDPVDAQPLGILENPALADEATAVWINPAGLGFRRSTTFFGSASFGGDTTHVNALLAGGHLGAGWLRSDAESHRRDRWRLAFGGTGPAGLLGFGAAFQWLVPEHGGRDFSADVGAMTRPAQWLSAGAVARDLGADRASEHRSYEVGLGLRPVGETLTLAGKARWTHGSPFKERTYWQVGGILNVGPGILVEGAYDKDRRVLAGAQIILGRASGGGAATWRRDGDGTLGWATVRLQSDIRATRIHMRGNVAEVRLSGTIRDQGSFSLLGGATYPLAGLVGQIRRAGDAPDVAVLYLRFEGMDIGQGMADELRASLVEFKERSGRPIVAYMTGADVREYYVASVADSIYLAPMADLSVVGYAAYPMFLRRALDKLHVVPEFDRIGKYKSATEELTDSTLSAPYREQLTSLLDDWYGRLVDAIAKGRDIAPDSVRTLIDGAPYMAADAKARGLVDGIGHEDRAFDAAKAMAKRASGHAGRRVHMAGRRSYNERWGTLPRVAVVFASGDIVAGTGGTDIISGTQLMGAETMARALRAVREDRTIKAVVLRIDSPGGDALASDLIWREVARLRESKKPVVVSVGDLAASGGYFIACDGDSIISNPGAIVGSIGIFTGKLYVAGLYDRLGVGVDVITRGDNAAIYSWQTSLTPQQRELVRRGLQYGYDVFVSRVAEGRKMTAAEVDSVGRGRIYTGEQGIDRGLIDRIGGLEDAIRAAMHMARIADRAEIVAYPRRAPFWQQFASGRPLGIQVWQPAGNGWFYDPVAAELR